jgi:hypothetical protein
MLVINDIACLDEPIKEIAKHARGSDMTALR